MRSGVLFVPEAIMVCPGIRAMTATAAAAITASQMISGGKNDQAALIKIKIVLQNWLRRSSSVFAME
jgi:hypothetical protein